jgi:hypothetical protein
MSRVHEGGCADERIRSGQNTCVKKQEGSGFKQEGNGFLKPAKTLDCIRSSTQAGFRQRRQDFRTGLLTVSSREQMLDLPYP